MFLCFLINLLVLIFPWTHSLKPAHSTVNPINRQGFFKCSYGWHSSSPSSPPSSPKYTSLTRRCDSNDETRTCSSAIAKHATMRISSQGLFALLQLCLIVITHPSITAAADMTSEDIHVVQQVEEKSGLSDPAKILSGCDLSACVSTSSVRKLDNYSPPWTYECSPDEAFARLKGVIASDPTLTVIEVDEGSRYIKVEAKRNALVRDEVEFIIRDGDDRVVTFRSAEIGATAGGGGLSDFGANRNRLETMRKKAGVFDIMGGGLTADSYGAVKGQGKGPLGQLKAFYGLQSGEGFQSVFED